MSIRKKPVDVLGMVCLILVFASSLFSSAGCARPPEEMAAMKAEPAKIVQDSSALASQEEKLSYALGMVLGNQFREQAMEVDLERYTQGLRDALAGGKTLLTESEARASVSALQTELKLRKRISPPPDAAATGIEVSFKLDPRLTRSMYMGDRWVSPPTFTSTLQTGTEITVEARAKGVGAQGRAIQIRPEWIPEDPEMVTVIPGQGDQVAITVKRAGQSKLKVAVPGVFIELSIKAIFHGDTVQVEISQ
jgi:hypothetical protein